MYRQTDVFGKRKKLVLLSLIRKSKEVILEIRYRLNGSVWYTWKLEGIIYSPRTPVGTQQEIRRSVGPTTTGEWHARNSDKPNETRDHSRDTRTKKIRGDETHPVPYTYINSITLNLGCLLHRRGNDE